MMTALLHRLRCLLPAVWLGVLLCVAGIATPAPFATLAKPDAGRVVAHIFATEAPLSMGLALVLVLLERRLVARALNTTVLLALGALFCTVLGYYALQPMMAAARAGQGAWSFGQLHAISLGLFALKIALVAALAWRVSRAPSS